MSDVKQSTVSLEITRPDLIEIDLSYITQAEAARAQKMHIKTRQLFLAGRILLRRKLASIMDMAPQDVPIMISQNGRPYVQTHYIQTSKKAGPFFSLSHTSCGNGAWIACAISQTADIGFDMEAGVRSVDWRRMASRRFSKAEWQRMQSLSDTEGRDMFFRLWTMKEATVKLEDGKLLPTLRKACINWRDGKPFLVEGGPELYSKAVTEKGLYIGLASRSEMTVKLSIG